MGLKETVQELYEAYPTNNVLRERLDLLKDQIESVQKNADFALNARSVIADELARAEKKLSEQDLKLKKLLSQIEELTTNNTRLANKLRFLENSIQHSEKQSEDDEPIELSDEAMKILLQILRAQNDGLEVDLHEIAEEQRIGRQLALLKVRELISEGLIDDGMDEYTDFDEELTYTLTDEGRNFLFEAGHLK